MELMTELRSLRMMGVEYTAEQIEHLMISYEGWGFKRQRISPSRIKE